MEDFHSSIAFDRFEYDDHCGKIKEECCLVNGSINLKGMGSIEN